MRAQTLRHAHMIDTEESTAGITEREGFLFRVYSRPLQSAPDCQRHTMIVDPIKALLRRRRIIERNVVVVIVDVRQRHWQTLRRMHWRRGRLFLAT